MKTLKLLSCLLLLSLISCSSDSFVYHIESKLTDNVLLQKNEVNQVSASLCLQLNESNELKDYLKELSTLDVFELKVNVENSIISQLENPRIIIDNQEFMLEQTSDGFNSMTDIALCKLISDKLLATNMVFIDFVSETSTLNSENLDLEINSLVKGTFVGVH